MRLEDAISIAPYIRSAAEDVQRAKKTKVTKYNSVTKK